MKLFEMPRQEAKMRNLKKPFVVTAFGAAGIGILLLLGPAAFATLTVIERAEVTGFGQSIDRPNARQRSMPSWQPAILPDLAAAAGNQNVLATALLSADVPTTLVRSTVASISGTPPVGMDRATLLFPTASSPWAGAAPDARARDLQRDGAFDDPFATASSMPPLDGSMAAQGRGAAAPDRLVGTAGFRHGGGSLVSAVPEPEMWTMGLAGAFLIGLQLRRRSGAVPVAA